MQYVKPRGVIAALDALATRADELENVTMPTLITGAPDRSAAVVLVQRALTDAEVAADLISRGGLGEEAIRAARMSVTLLEHAAIDDIALRSTADGLRRSLDTIRASPAMREFGARALVADASAATTRDEWSRLAAKLAAMPTAARRTELDALLATPRERLDRAAFGRIAAHLDVDPTVMAKATLDEIATTEPLANLAHRISDGSEPITTGTKVLDEFAFRTLAPDGAAAFVDDLMTRQPSELTSQDWSRLASVVERDVDGALTTVPRKLEGSMPLVEQAREIAAGTFAPQKYMQVYFDQYAVRRLAPAERTAAAEALLSKDPDALTPDEWRRLATLVDLDPDESLIPVAREISGSLPFATQARAIAEGEYRPSRYMQAYFDRFAVDRLPSTQRATVADSLLTRNPDDLTNAEWRQLAALVDSDTDGSLIPVARKLEGVESLSSQARSIGAGEARPSPDARVYFDAYAVARLAPEVRAAEVETLMLRDPDSLTSGEWGRLAAILDLDVDGSLVNVPRKLEDSLPLTQQARAIAAGEYRPSRYMQVYFDQYAVARLAPAERASIAHSLLIRAPDDLTNAEWRQLAALVDSDPDGSLISVTREFAGSESLVKQARAIAAGESRPSRHVHVYFDTYAVARLAPEARAAEVQALLFRDPASLTSDEWRRLAAILDSDVDGSLVNIPRTLEGVLPLTQQAREIADGEYRPTVYMQKYFTEYLRRNDPAYAVRLEGALDEVVTGRATADSRELVAREWDRLEQLVAGRPPGEQSAIAQVMLGMDSVAGSRSVKSTLELLRTGMPGSGELAAEFHTLREQTLELLDRNIARLDGSTPSGAVAGYSNHPDYAEIGRIRANIGLIQEAQAMATRPKAVPIEPTVAPAGGDGAGTSTSGETLTW